MGDRGRAHDDRQADPRQRSASRSRRADPLVSRAHRHAAGLGEGRHDSRHAGRAARPERPHRLGLHHRLDRHAGSVRRDARPRRPQQISDAGRARSRSRRARRSSTSRARPTCALTVRATRHGPVLSDVDQRAARGRRAGQGDGARLHRPRRQGHDLRRDLRARTRRRTGTSSSPRCGCSRRRRRTSSTPTSTATSASSAPASCRCASPATG